MDYLEYIGKIVGDYRLLRWLGGGGFGNVYQAERVGEGQIVAVKVLRIQLSKQDDLRTFINEARTMSLRHPHIVPLLDFGLSHDDIPFLVMEYAPNGTLRDQHPKGSQVPLLTAVEYASQVASALQYAHNSHLIHRDVKPENMLVRSDGTVLLSDFGIATVAHTTNSPATDQEMAGTVPYMAPEQLAGKPRAGSDQYALAVVVYEWLAGRVPFKGTAIEVALQHATQPPPSLIVQMPYIPQEVEAVLFKALAKDYKERFLSVQAFLTALQRASSSSTFHSPAIVRPSEPPFKESALPSVPLSSARGYTTISAPSIGKPSPSLLPRRATSDRERMLGRLRKTYRSLLVDSLYGITWMVLGLANKPDAVRNASHLLLRLPERNEQILPSGTSILYAYEQAQEELLILGAPGAGKSTLLLDLALQLVEHADADETHPLPIILPLSSWAVQQSPLAEWLTEQLAQTYDIPHILSKRWVEQEYILPLLDGLDEMEETARSACITAINTYHREHLNPLVVCSRQNEYEVATTRERLGLQSAVVVQPLTFKHVEQSLHTAGPAFSDLRVTLEQRPALRELATTPLMLSVLLLTYQGASLDAIIQPDVDLEQRVWTDYVARMVKRKGDETRYSLQHTCSWLTWLAQQMQLHQQTIFYAEYLHVDWLTSQQQRIIMWLTIRLPAILLGGLTAILIFLFLPYYPHLMNLLQVGLLGGFVGNCLSQEAAAGTAMIGRHQSASKQVNLLICVLLGALMAASFGLSLVSPNPYPAYSLSNWLQDGSIFGLGSGLSAWAFQVLLFRRPRRQVSISSTSLSLRWRVSTWFTTIAPQNVWQAAFMLGAGMGLSYGLSNGLNYMVSDKLNYGLGYGLRDELRDGLSGLSDGLNYGLGIGLIAVLISVILAYSIGPLRFAERMHWTWRSLLRPGHLCTEYDLDWYSFPLIWVEQRSVHRVGQRSDRKSKRRSDHRIDRRPD